MDPSATASICYQRNCLISVIARVDFIPELSRDLSDLPQSVRSEAMRHFRVSEGGPISGIQARATGEALELTHSNFRVERFFGSEREKWIEITPGSILTSYIKYKRYDDLRAEFFGVLQALAVARTDTQIRRIGFRFINILPHPVQGGAVNDWAGYINPALIAANSYSVLDGRVNQHGHRIEFVYSDHRMLMNYGMHNADYPAPLCKKEFVIDLDAFCDDPASVPPLLASGEYLDKLHATIQSAFEEAITDQMREVLGREGGSTRAD